MAIIVTKLPSTDKVLLTPEELTLVANKEMTRKFGQPEDFVELHVYNNTNTLLQSIVPFKNYKVPNSGVTGDVEEAKELEFDPAVDIQTLGYSQGNYIVDYNVLRPKIYSGVERVFFVKEISSDRLELRLNSTTLNNQFILENGSNFINEFQNTPYFKEFYLNFGQNRFIPAVNIALDLNTANYSILIKLNKSLPIDFKINDKVGIVDKLSIDDRFSVSISFEIPTPTLPTLRSANFNIDVDSNIIGSTPYYNYNQITTITGSENPTLQKLLNYMSSSTFQINVDYTDYNNFIHFSSAKNRLDAFKYKLTNIENYNYIISSASASPASATISIVSSSLKSIDGIIQSFDGWENYMYFESSSYAWPKSNSTKPYQLYSVTSSEGITWYNNEYASSVTYDDNNQNYLINALPTYITDNSDNDELFQYVAALGQMFDEIWLYIKAIVDLYQAKNKLSEGISKDLVYYALQSVGIKVYTDEDGTETFDYLYGVNQNGTYLPVTSSYQTLISASEYQISGQDQIKSFYKRLYNNLPALLKSKGTNKFADYLSTVYGITDTILKPLEFGGIDKNESTVEYSFNRFTYAIQLSGSQYFYTPWDQFESSYIEDSNTDSAAAFEFRFKPFVSSSSTSIASTQSLAVIDFTGVGGPPAPTVIVNLVKYPTSSYNYGYVNLLVDTGSQSYKQISAGPLPIFVTNSLGDYNWYNVLVQRTSGSLGYTYELFVKNEIDGEIGHQASGSYLNNPVTSSLNNSWTGSADSYLYLGGYTSTTSKTGVKFSGSFQELRIWGSPLLESKFNHHTLNPESFEGNVTSSAYNNLIGRFPLGNDLYTYNHSIINSVSGTQPNQSNPYTNYPSSNTAEIVGFSNFDNFINYNPFTEYYYTTPAISTYLSPVNNKIRIVSSSVYGDILTLNKSIVQNPILTNTTDIHLYQFGFSPQDEVNEDIIAQLGNTYNIDNIIGDPSTAPSSSYEQLTLLQNEYFKKYINKYNYKDFEVLINYFHNSIFRFIQDFTPGRSNTATGLIYKPTLLERNKQARYEPTWDQTLYTASYSYPNISGAGGCAIPDIPGTSTQLNATSSYGFSNFTLPYTVIESVNLWELNPGAFSDGQPLTVSFDLFFNSGVSTDEFRIYNGTIFDSLIASYPPDVSTRHIEFTYNTSLQYLTFYMFATPGSASAAVDNLIINANTNIGRVSSPTGSFYDDNLNYYKYNGEITGSYINFMSYYDNPNPFSLFDEDNNGTYQEFLSFSLSGSFGSTESEKILRPLKTNTNYILTFTLLECNDDLLVYDGNLNTIVDIPKGVTGTYSFNFNSGGPSYGQVQFINLGNYAPDNTITISNIVIQDPLLVTEFNAQYGGFDAITNNVEQNRLSDIAKLVSYNEDGSTVISEIELQDALYDSSLALPRIDGTKTTSVRYNEYSNGDTTYGKTATVDKRQSYFAYFDWNGGSLAERSGSWNYHIKFICDENGAVLSPTNLLSYNGEYLLALQSNFQKDSEVNISNNLTNLVSVSGSSSNTYIIYRPGQLASTIIYTDTGSHGLGYLVSGTIPYPIFFDMPNNAAYEQHFYTYISSSTPQPFSNSASGSNAYKVQYDLVIADEQGDYNITNYQYTSSFVTTVNSFITASLYVTNNVFPSGYSCSIQILKNNTIIKESQKLVSLSNQGIGTSVAINEINPGDVFEVRLSAGEPTVNPNPLTITTNIGTYFSIVPRTGSTSITYPLWTTGQTIDTVLTASNTLSPLYNGEYYQRPIPNSGFDPPQKFTLQYADEIRFMGNEDYVNMINDVYVDDETGILYVYLATPIDKSKLDINYFSIRRFVDDVGFIMINGDGGDTDGFIFPKYPSTTLKNNLSKIQKDLITSGLIPG